MRQLLKSALALCMSAALCLVILSGCKKEEPPVSFSPASSQSQAQSSSPGGPALSSLPQPSSPLSSQPSSRAESEEAESHSSSSQPSSSSEPSPPPQSQTPEDRPSVFTQGAEIPYDYQLLRDFSGFINLTIHALAYETFEYGWIDNRNLMNAGMELCRDSLNGQEDPKVEKSYLLEKVTQYFDRSVPSPEEGGNFCHYQDGYYYPTPIFEASDEYKFEAQRAYDLGDNYIRVEGETTLRGLDGTLKQSGTAVYVLHRVPSSYYGYHWIAQSYQSYPQPY